MTLGSKHRQMKKKQSQDGLDQIGRDQWWQKEEARKLDPFLYRKPALGLERPRKQESGHWRHDESHGQHLPQELHHALLQAGSETGHACHKGKLASDA